jgi:hypothetical protein
LEICEPETPKALGFFFSFLFISSVHGQSIETKDLSFPQLLSLVFRYLAGRLGQAIGLSKRVRKTRKGDKFFLSRVGQKPNTQGFSNFSLD